MKILKRIGIVLLLIVLVLTTIFMIPIGPPEDNYMSEHFSKIEDYLENRDAKNTNVSQVDVAWHLDHVLKAIIAMHTSMESSDPTKFDGGKFSLPKEFIFLMGDFPRGVAQAPDHLRPPADIKTDDILNQLEEARERMSRLKELDPDQYWKNDAFGQMPRNEAVRFIEIHTDHHFKIIEDILTD